MIHFAHILVIKHFYLASRKLCLKIDNKWILTADLRCWNRLPWSAINNQTYFWKLYLESYDPTYPQYEVEYDDLINKIHDVNMNVYNKLAYIVSLPLAPLPP